MWIHERDTVHERGFWDRRLRGVGGFTVHD